MIENSAILEKSTQKQKIKEFITLIFAVLVLECNIFVYVSNGIMLQRTSEAERVYANQVIQEIKNYEKETGKQITKVAFYNKKNSQKTFYNYPNNSLTLKTIQTRYANLDFIQYYLGRSLEEVEVNKEIAIYYLQKDWQEFSKEQLVFKEDTLHLCIY